jgi:hypothetical protein
VVSTPRLERSEPAAEASELIRRQLGNSFGDLFDFHVTQYSGQATESDWLAPLPPLFRRAGFQIRPAMQRYLEPYLNRKDVPATRERTAACPSKTRSRELRFAFFERSGHAFPDIGAATARAAGNSSPDAIQRIDVSTNSSRRLPHEERPCEQFFQRKRALTAHP